MADYREKHPIASAPGAFAIAAWSAYVLFALVYYPPDFPPSVLAAGCIGIGACVAVAFNFKYWRAAILVASSIYLLLYAIRIIRMTGMTTDLSFLSALFFYFSASLGVATGVFQEKGVSGGLAHAFLEFAMPVLMVALIGVVLIFRRPKPGSPPDGRLTVGSGQ